MIPRLPYGKQTIGQEEHDLVKEVLNSDWLTQGPRLGEFESSLRELCQARHAFAVTNGTDALLLACRAAGLGPGDRFLTTTNTFAATANVGVMCGAEPVFVDIDPGTLNLDPELVEKALAADPSIKVMLPVHFGGLVCHMERLAEVANRYNVTIIEDACHAIGGHWLDQNQKWHSVGSCAHSALTCFSFHPVKCMTTGEGGAVTTNDDKLAQRIALLRSHGITKNEEILEKNDGGWYYEMHDLGVNARLTDLQAALGLAQIKRLPSWQKRRLQLVQQYDADLADLDQVSTQTRPNGEDRNCYHLMVVRASRRRELYDHLHAQGILVQVHYIPVHLQPYYRKRFGTGEGLCPEAEKYYSEALSLPLFPGMSDGDQQRTVAAVRDFYL